MARFLSLLVLFLATWLLAVGPAASMSAAESNRIGAAELPEVNPLTPSSAPAAEPVSSAPPPPSAGEAERDDAAFAHAAVWEWQGDGQLPARHIEPLVYEETQLSTRSYK